MDDKTARQFAGDAPLNTDDNALIEFHAPLTMHNWAATQQSNARVLRALLLDPLAHARWGSPDAEKQAESYARLADAFFGKQMFGQAANAMRRAQELSATSEGASRLARYEAAARNQKGL
jgi:hypothetical protein